MTSLDEAIAIVEAAGYTVTDERMRMAYYQCRERRFRTLFCRAEDGDWVAAVHLIQHSMRALDSLPSRALRDMVALVLSRALSERPITTALKAGKRMRYPILAALLRSGRKDYVRLEQGRTLERYMQAYLDNLGERDLKVLLGKSMQGAGSERDQLIKWLAKSLGMPGDIKSWKKWIAEAKKYSSSQTLKD